MNRARAAAIASASVVLAASQLAAADIKLRTDVSPRQVEIGAQFSVRLSISSDGRESVSEPELKVPSGVRIFGTSVQQGSSVSITWMLMASRAGKFKIGPASVVTSKGRKSDKTVTVEVVPQGTLSPGNTPPLGGQPSPLSILRGFGGSNFPGLPGFPGFDQPEAPPELPPLPEGYAVERAQDPIAFLRATAVPRQVVVNARVEIEKLCGIPGRAVMIGASHSHSSGPVGMILPGQFDGAPEEVRKLAYEESSMANADYLARVTREIVEGVRLADAARVPAQLGFGYGHEDKVAFNRRQRMKNGQSWSHAGAMNPDIVDYAAPIDPQVGVIGAWDAKGKLLGTVVNFYCHATTNPGGISANWIY